MTDNDQNVLVEQESFMRKLKKKFASKEEKEAMRAIYNKGPLVKGNVVGYNRYIDICAEACSCCWDKSIPDDFEGRANYISKRVRMGHSSVIEHSNFVVLLTFENADNELVEFLSRNHYLYTIAEKIDNVWYVLVGGSFRGYADLFKEYKELNTAALNIIKKLIFEHANSAMFADLIHLGLLDENRFLNAPYSDSLLLCDDVYNTKDDLLDIISMDCIYTLYSNIKDLAPEFATKIDTPDLIKFVSVTVLFKNMSRTCTHQLVRHRNAITQESQRYVDYSKACFADPATFKPEKYDVNHKYKVTFGSSSPMMLTLKEIGEAEASIYAQLNNAVLVGNDYALAKEDARAFLPSNIQCKKIYVTFTFKSLFKFLELREDTAAQREIRLFATKLGDIFRTNTKFTEEDKFIYSKPRILIENDDIGFEDMGEVTEEVEESEVIAEPTDEENYIKAIGLDREEENK